MKSLNLWGIIAATSLLAGTASHATQPEATAHGTKITASVTISNPQITIGETFGCSVRIKNEANSPVSVLDPRKSLMPHERCVFVIYDRNNHRLGQIPFQGLHTNGSHGPWADKSYWIELPPGSVMDFEVRTLMPSAIENRPLSPGQYRLQLNFVDTFPSEYPYSNATVSPIAKDKDTQSSQDEQRAAWMLKHPGKELFGTNLIDVVVSQGGPG
jgi:hypothetical protein